MTFRTLNIELKSQNIAKSQYHRNWNFQVENYPKIGRLWNKETINSVEKFDLNLESMYFILKQRNVMIMKFVQLHNWPTKALVRFTWVNEENVANVHRATFGGEKKTTSNALLWLHVQCSAIHILQILIK